MSFCETCIQANAIPECTTNLVVGTTTPNTTFDVYFKHVGNNRIDLVQQIASDGAGLLTVDLTGFNKQVDQTYELYINDPASNQAKKKVDITVGIETEDCINLQFCAVNENDLNKPFTTQVISLQ